MASVAGPPGFVPRLHEQFETHEQQGHAVRLGFWLFLASEVLLFSGLFALYGAYRFMYREDFLAAAKHNDMILGSLNTVILITSSFTVALAIHATRKGKRGLTVGLLAVTLLLAGLFLVVKGIEYGAHFDEGIYPGIYYNFAHMQGAGAKLFFTLYFFMSGLHALHVIGGMSALVWVMARARQGRYSPAHHVPLELAGLYWHLVDLIWIFLWPLLYLTR